MTWRPSIAFFLPPEWRAPVAKMRRLRVLSKWDAILIAGLSIVAIMLETFSVAMLFPILDFISGGRDVQALAEKSRMWSELTQVFGFIGVPVTLATLCLTVLILVLGRQVFSMFRNLTMERVRSRVSRDLSVQCFRAIQSADASYLREFGAGNFAHIVNIQCDSAASLIRNLTSLFSNTVTFASYGLVMLITTPIATGLAVAMGLVSILSVSHYVRASRRLSTQMVRAKERFTQSLTERYQAWRLIKLHNAVDLETANTRTLANEIYGLNVGLALVSGKLQLLVAPMLAAFALGTLFVSVEVLDLQVAAVTLFFVVLLRLMPLMTNFATLRQTIAVIDTVLDRVCITLADAAQHREVDAGQKVFRSIAGSIEFTGVTFSYPDTKEQALKGCTLTIPARRFLAITGPTGSGKSTLVDLIPRIIEAQGGAISFDGIPASAFSRESLRDQISFVSQTPLILNASVADNVRYGRPDAAHDDVVAACNRAHADEFITRLPNAYNTILGEGGARLSGGQRQRLALSRALLRGASILILDEPTSALDYETEQKIQRSLDRVVADGNTTVIVIAHRLSTIRKADQLVVLKEGRVVQSGAPIDLSRIDGWYSSMLKVEAQSTA